MKTPLKCRTEFAKEFSRILHDEVLKFLDSTDEDGLTEAGFELLSIETEHNGRGIILAAMERNDGEVLPSHLLGEATLIRDVGFEEMESFREQLAESGVES